MPRISAQLFIIFSTFLMSLGARAEALSTCDVSVDYHQNGDTFYRVSEVGTSKWTKINIPDSELPMADGLDIEVFPTYLESEPARLTYNAGILTFTHRQPSNYTKDTVSMEVTPSLSDFGEIHWTRTGIGFAGLFVEKQELHCLGQWIAN